jgi:6-phosphogluconate dehydrogenase
LIPGIPDTASARSAQVHNGIEYGVMQLICEVYHLMRANGTPCTQLNLLCHTQGETQPELWIFFAGMTHAEMRDVFDKWNGAELDSYLIDISTKGATDQRIVVVLLFQGLF